ncbi:MAG: di-trans,poly-cis-decaprenylcistransferase [Gammaproteobacteria bacterium]|nr:di-trans,poly-cis-decaprenylcistransferase [Gammaproteobacteria bacterium]
MSKHSDSVHPVSGDQKLPRHVAIIMDGNGRWAKKRMMPRVAGHRAGVEVVRRLVELCRSKGIEVLTLFAFSSENWRRPEQEVSLLMELFVSALKREASKLHKNGVRLKVIGDCTALNSKLQHQIEDAERLTAGNNKLTLVIAANYGGRWDITEAARQLARQVEAGGLKADQIDEARLAGCLSLADCPEPDLFIRTGGEQRISNFLLWQLAYTELYITDTLWPDFNESAFDSALSSFANRQRRFGRTGEQVAQSDTTQAEKGA